MDVSEFFSIIAAFAAGLFIIGLLTANGPSSDPLGRSRDATPALGMLLALGLLGIGFARPLPVFADNGSSFTDIWNVLVFAAISATAMPFLLTIAAGEGVIPPDVMEEQREFWGVSSRKPGPKPPPPPMFGTSGKNKPPWRKGTPWPKGWCRGKNEGNKPPRPGEQDY
jgi:hypothetical protein